MPERVFAAFYRRLRLSQPRAKLRRALRFENLEPRALLAAIGPASTITTIAGDGVQGYSGDGGPSTMAELNYPVGVATDNLGHLFLADQSNVRVREVDLASGIITTVAGNGTGGYSGDGGPATAAQLSQAGAMAVDASGHLFIADGGRVREVDLSTGVITTVADFEAGSGCVTRLAVDNSGNLFVDSYEVIKPSPDPSGVVHPIAYATGGYVREINLSSGAITTVAGNGSFGSGGDGGPATAASIDEPCGVAVDATGHLFIADVTSYLPGSARIREVDLSTGVITTVAGGGTSGPGDGGPATAAQLNNVEDIALDAGGHLFINDGGQVREVDLSTGLIATVAGNGTNGYSGDGGPATAASLSISQGIAVDANGNLFIADGGNNRVREVAPALAGVADLPASSGAHASTPALYDPGNSALVHADLGPVGTSTVTLGSNVAAAPALLAEASAPTVVANSELAATAAPAAPINPQAVDRIDLSTVAEQTLTPGVGLDDLGDMVDLRSSLALGL